MSFHGFSMKIQRECVPCLLKRCIYEAKESTDNIKIQTQAIQNACKTLAKYYDPNACSAEIATKVHKVVYDS